MPAVNDAATRRTLSMNSAAAGVFSVAALTLAYTHSNVARQIVPMFIGSIQQDLGLSDVGISLAGGFAFALFYSVMGIPLGRLVDLADRRRLILLSVLLWTAMTALCGLGPTVALFVIGRIGLGLSEAVVVPASLSMFNDQFPRHRLALAVNVFFTGAWLGNGIAYLLGAWIMDHGALIASLPLPGVAGMRTWQLAFLLIAIVGIPVWMACLFLREPSRRIAGNAGALPSAAVDAAPATAAGGGLRQLIGAFRTQPRLYLGIIIGVTIYSSAVSGAAFWAVEYFVRDFGSDRAHVSALYGLQGVIAGPAGLVFAGWLADYAERRGALGAKLQVAIGSLLLLMLLGVAFFFIDSERTALAAFVLLTLLTPVAYGTGASALQSATPAGMQGLMIGFYTFITNAVGMGLGPTAIALAAGADGPSAGSLAAGIAIVMLLMVPVACIALWTALGPYREWLAAEENGR